MPNHIKKSFQVYMSKIKFSNKQIQSSLRSCKLPRTASFGGQREVKENDAVSLPDTDQYLLEKLRSFYRRECKAEMARINGQTASYLFDSPPENLGRSARFFVASGSSSPSITDEARFSAATSDAFDSSTAHNAVGIGTGDSPAPDDFITILAYSPSPYEDFRRSMERMVEVRMERAGGVDWKFMEELLSCYLDLNNEKFSRHITRAFVDLVVVLCENSWRIPLSVRLRHGG